MFTNDNKPTMQQALQYLGLTAPKIKKTMTQVQVDELVVAWKANELQEALREHRKKWHPDRHAEKTAEERRVVHETFNEGTFVYEYITANFKLRKPEVPVSSGPSCRFCGTPRLTVQRESGPAVARHCHECGKMYTDLKARTSCPVCHVSRMPDNAKFCVACGYDYQVPDPLLALLLSIGFLEEDVSEVRQEGSLRVWRERYSANPLDPHLQNALRERLVKLRMSRLLRR